MPVSARYIKIDFRVEFLLFEQKHTKTEVERCIKRKGSNFFAYATLHKLKMNRKLLNETLNTSYLA